MKDEMDQTPGENAHAQPDSARDREDDAIPEGGDEQPGYDLNLVIENLCISKAKEFRMLGYEQVSGRDIWDCVSDKYHKSGIPPLHQVVNDILSLKSTQFMNWMTMRVYRGSF